MKLKFIRDDEVVITHKEYMELLDRSIELKRTFHVSSEKCQVSSCAILKGTCPLLSKFMNSKKK